MSDLLKMYDDLLKDTGPAAIVLKQWLKPVGGEVFYPPTYANPSQKKGDPPVYNIDRFGELVAFGKKSERFKDSSAFADPDVIEHEGKHSVCVVDSIPSQANRIEPAFARLRDKDGKTVKLVPNAKVEAKVKTSEGEQTQTVDLLEAGHRIADAIVRFSNKANDVTKAIKARAHGDSAPLAKLAPTSLVFGIWDSRDTGVKVPRLLNSIILAYDVLEHRRSAQYFPALDYAGAGVTAEKSEQLGKLSEEGMAEAPAVFQHGGVEARGGICREASLNLATLRDIVSNTPDGTLKLQRYILGLSLVALTYLDGKILNLRQGCQLVGIPDKPMSRKLINADGTESDCDVDWQTALDFANAAAEDFGIGGDWAAVFDPKLAKAALKKPEKKKDGGAG